MITRSPAATQRAATARPMPVPPPVTRTVRLMNMPSSSFRSKRRLAPGSEPNDMREVDPGWGIGGDEMGGRMSNRGDSVDEIAVGWERERPGTPVDSIGVVTRIWRLGKLFADDRRRVLVAA